MNGWRILVLIFVTALALAAAGCAPQSSSGGSNHPGDDDNDAVDDDASPGSRCGDPLLDKYAADCPTYKNPCAFANYEYNYDQDQVFDTLPGLTKGDIEAMMFKFKTPYHVQKLKFYFGGGAGTARIHLYGDMLGSVPMVAPWTTFIKTVEYMTPIDVQVPAGPGWVEVDVSSLNLLFLPGTKVWAAFEHLSTDGLPKLYYSTEGSALTISRFYTPTNYATYGDNWGYLTVNDSKFFYYMIRLEGRAFCQLETPPYFTDITAKTGVKVAGQQRPAWVDLDGDGKYDLLLTNLNTTSYPANLTYWRNNGDGTFTDQTAAAGLDVVKYSAVTAVADLNNDGAEDIISIVAVPHDNPDSVHGERTKVLLNDGHGHFTIKENTGLCTDDMYYSAASLGDYDRDGFLDIYVGSWLQKYPYPASDPGYLFHNKGDVTFEDVSLISGVRENDNNPGDYKPCYGVTWVDYNEDGWYDIFISNYGREYNRLLQNQHDGTFIDVEDRVHLERPHDPWLSGPGNTFGADFGDVFNRGVFDAMVSDIAHPRYQPGSGPSSFNKNSGPPDYTFTWDNDTIGYHADEGDVDPSFVDYNNDGRLDIFMSSLYNGHYSRLYEQQPDGTCLDVTYWAGLEVQSCTGNAWADIDGSGRMSLIEATDGRGDIPGGGIFIFQNTTDYGNNWLEIKLVGTTDNRDAIGAKIVVTAGSLMQSRYIQGPRGGYASTPMLAAHFGMAKEGVADKIDVRWPNGTTETWTGVSVNQRIKLTQGDPTVGTW